MGIELFMVRTNDMELAGFNTNVAKKLGEYLPRNEIVRYRAVDIEVSIPFKKTNNTEREEYVEMLTGTVYHKENDKYVSEDSLVSFTTIFDYDAYLFNYLCCAYSLRKIIRTMKLIYDNNRKIYAKEEIKSSIEEKGNKVLKKLERKYKSKLEGRK